MTATVWVAAYAAQATYSSSLIAAYMSVKYPGEWKSNAGAAALFGAFWPLTMTVAVVGFSFSLLVLPFAWLAGKSRSK